MIDHQLALFLDGDWSGAAEETALQQLQALTRPDIVHAYYDRGDATVFLPPFNYAPNLDPVRILELPERRPWEQQFGGRQNGGSASQRLYPANGSHPYG